MLTQKQEKFVQNLIIGMSQREAYKNSYNASNMADDTIDNKACNLFKQDKIRTRYEELIGILNEKNTEKAIMSAQERMEFLTDIIKEKEQEDLIMNGLPVGKKVADLNTKLKALDILNKMSGEYIEKLKIGNENNDKPFEVNINVVK